MLHKVRITPGLLRLGMNLWPPFIGAGIHGERSAADCRAVTVRLRMGPLNRNCLGTHFGGPLFAIADPFVMRMMMHRLGPGHIVWDKRSEIRFRRPATGRVWARFALSEAQIEAALAATASGESFEPTYTVAIEPRNRS